MFTFFNRKKQPIPLPFTTDIHCHIVPGVDDGSPDASTSADLVERMAAWGITRIIATPHITEASFENTPDILDPALEELHDALRARGITIPVTRASENRIDGFFRSQLEKGLITTHPNKYLLLENAWLQEPFQLDQYLYDLKLEGYKPILAHPERYPYYSEGAPERYDRLHRAGVLFQVNVLSLAGHYGKREKAAAEYLIQKDYVDFLGTDLHNRRHADAIDAYLATRDAQRHADALRDRIFNERVFD